MHSQSSLSFQPYANSNPQQSGVGYSPERDHHIFPDAKDSRSAAAEAIIRKDKNRSGDDGGARRERERGRQHLAARRRRDRNRNRAPWVWYPETATRSLMVVAGRQKEGRMEGSESKSDAGGASPQKIIGGRVELSRRVAWPSQPFVEQNKRAGWLAEASPSKLPALGKHHPGRDRRKGEKNSNSASACKFRFFVFCFCFWVWNWLTQPVRVRIRRRGIFLFLSFSLSLYRARG